MRPLTAWVLTGLLLAASAHAQDQPEQAAGVLRLADVEVRGELGPFERVELEELLRTRSDRRLLGIPGVTPGRWIYELGSERSAVGRALRRAGEPPALYDPALVAADRERLEGLYRQAGFLTPEVTATADALRGERVRVVFRVAPGPASVLRRVRYDGLGALTPDERRRIARRSALALDLPPAPDSLAALTFRARPGQRLAEAALLEERRRLLADLRDLGFARVTRDSIRAVAFPGDTLADGRPLFEAAFEVSPGPRFAFGDVRFVVTGPEEAPRRADTLGFRGGAVAVSIEDERRLSPALLRRALRFVPGDPYRLSDLLATKRRLETTGVFSFSEVTPLAGEVAPPLPGDSLPRLPHRIALRTRQRHGVRLEGFVLQRTGLLVGDGSGLDEEELGVGVGAAYRNANWLGAGEQLALRASGSVAGDFAEELGTFPTAQAEGSAALTLPYLVWPFGFAERALRPFDARTRLRVGALTARRDELRLLIRGRLDASVRFELRHTPTVTSLLDLADFALSDPDTLGGFRRRFLDLVEDPVARQFVLEDYTRPQLNNAVRYTLRAATADPFRRDRGYAAEASVEAGGHLSELLDRVAFTPDTLEGSLPGLPVFGGGSRLEYRPYVRLAADGRRYLRPSRLVTVAAKAIVGVAHPTGAAPVVPFDRRFYVGGANSVRGWSLRALGPGQIPPEESAFVQGGDVKLEASLEARRVVLRAFLGADWQLAAFVDAGNVWFGPRNPGDADGRFRLATFYEEVAVGSGTGLRIAWDFLILRLDLAWKVRSPVPGEALFPDGRRPTLHFGIGQAF